MDEIPDGSGDLPSRDMTEVFRKRAAALAKRRQRESGEDAGIPVLVFSAGGERFALALEDLAEVLPFASHTPVPQSDSMMCGILNVRGELCSVLELGAVMGLDPQRTDEKGYVLILKKNGIGLRVQQLDRILTCRKDDLEEIRGDGDLPSVQYGRTVIQGTILLIDVETILSHPILSAS